MAEKITQSQLERILSAAPLLAERGESGVGSTLLDLLSSADREKFIHWFPEMQFASGEIIFRENEPGDTMCVVLNGRFAILKGDLDAPTVIGFRGTGEIVGEMSLLDNQPRSATIVALDELRLLCINRQGFYRLLDAMPSVSFRIMEVLSSRLRTSDEVLSRGDRSEKELISQVNRLQSEKQRLEEVQRLRQETSELILHDLRSPLSAIAISLKMLTVMLPEEVLKPHLQLINIAQASTARMRCLVDTLLDVACMESGETEINPGKLDVYPMLKDVVERLSIIAHKGVRINLEIPADLPPANADRDKIERVISNLLDNALKYTPNNGGIVIATHSQDGFIYTSVTDTGPGIPLDQRERIFERFSRVEGKQGAQRGFGLGLTYCRLAVERHGGKIWVEAGEGGTGSRFVFTLPVFQATNLY